MDTVVEFIKDIFIPGSVAFLLLGLVVGVLLLYLGDRTAKWGRRWLVLLAVVYVFMSIPLISNQLVGGLSAGFSPIEEVALVSDAEAIVVLGGGGATYQAGEQYTTALSESSTLRALEAARIYDMLEDPWVIVSGGLNSRAGLLDPESEPLRESLTKLGIPRENILLDSESQNTYEQGINVPPLLETKNIDSFILITSPVHMRRSLLVFQKVGLDPYPGISTQQSESQAAPTQSIIPDEDALVQSKAAMREIMALIYYALRGWI